MKNEIAAFVTGLLIGLFIAALHNSSTIYRLNKEVQILTGTRQGDLHPQPIEHCSNP